MLGSYHHYRSNAQYWGEAQEAVEDAALRPDPNADNPGCCADALKRALAVLDQPDYGDIDTRLDHAAEAMDVLRDALDTNMAAVPACDMLPQGDEWLYEPLAVVSQSASVQPLLPVWCYLNGFKVKPVVGFWQGEAEIAYVVTTKAFHRASQAGLFAGQKTVLLLSRAEPTLEGLRGTVLAGLTEAGRIDFGRVASLGHWRHVSRSEAMARQSYTFDPMAETFFATDLDPEPGRV